MVVQHSPIAHASCSDGMTPCAWTEWYQPGSNTLQVSWWYDGADPSVDAAHTDFYQVRWSVESGPETQVTINSGGSYGYYVLNNIDPGSYYAFKVQACQRHFLGSSDCTAWSDPAYYLPYGPDTCLVGYVWRDAFNGDHVCVFPSTRDQAAYDNSQAPYRVNPNGGPYGPDTCLVGFVWREATSYDHVCVTPDVRAQTAYDNSQAPYRRVAQ
jgi:hypothetical protein